MSDFIERHRHISITSTSSDGVTRTDVHITQISSDHFQPEAVCDPEELALIDELRAYLRPQSAPTQLIARLEATLDRCCFDVDDDDKAKGGDGPDSADQIGFHRA